ncbi:hypothetical protein ACEN4K_08945 [Marinilactibacillus psychrotolerans]|uniref:Uncharacterized protein n=1 Tax=Marinilactibacillus piezotolerans TaxID=258723 RepID=A0A1I3Y837_9LACT|nr:hypothetical protein [Marinilactibacillus piezotolerans]SFK28034.1 hypothetical protein SAMN04488569_10209 [Marinilactibacillus piezotolerans]
MKKGLVLTIEIIMSIALLIVPFIGDYITNQTSAIGSYYIAFFIVTCISVALFILMIGFSIIKFIQIKQ